MRISLCFGVSIAALTLAAGGPAFAQGADVQAQIDALKAQIRELKSELHAQASETRKVKRDTQAVKAQTAAQGQALAQAGPIVKGPPAFTRLDKFYYNGVTITLGGYFAAEGVWRQHDEGADIGDQPYGSLPALNTSAARMNELRFSARQSRISGLVEGQPNPATKLSGYAEFDFLGAANTANSNESNSYQPRVRQLYAAADWNDVGVHLLAGQAWSLVTMNSKGITPRNEVTPPVIDAQNAVGFAWARQPQLRLVKNFGDEFWIAASVEQPQTTGCPALALGTAFAPAPVAPPVASGFAGLDVTCSQQAGSGGLLDSLTTYSINHVPDVVGKVAWEPHVFDRTAHLEAFGIYRDLYDQVDYLTGPGGTLTGAYANRDTTGWGAGGGFVVPLVPKWLDFQGSAMVGRGIGRYGSSQLNDTTLNPDGSLRPIPEFMFLGGATLHATPQLDLYVFGGEEREFGTYTATGATSQVGLGDASAINNTGCYTIGGTCTGQTKDTWEITGGFWDKFYQGDFGSMRVGMQVSHIERVFFPGTVGLPAGSSPLSAKTTNNEVRASLRFYPFDAPPPPPAVAAKY